MSRVLQPERAAPPQSHRVPPNPEKTPVPQRAFRESRERGGPGAIDYDLYAALRENTLVAASQQGQIGTLAFRVEAITPSPVPLPPWRTSQRAA